MRFALCWGFAWRWQPAVPAPGASTDAAGGGEKEAAAAAPENGAVPGGAQESGILAAQLPQDGRKLIMNAELAVEALDFDKTLAALRVAAGCGGRVSLIYLSGGRGGQRRTLCAL